MESVCLSNNIPHGYNNGIEQEFQSERRDNIEEDNTDTQAEKMFSTFDNNR